MNKKIISNSLWMMTEKLISIFGLIFVTSFVAKYIGPSVFGEIAFLTSLFQIVQVISQLGSDVVIFKRISTNIKSGIILINATLQIRALVYFLFSIPVLLYATIFNKVEGGEVYLYAVFISLFISAMDLYSVYFDSVLKSKVNTLINLAGLVVSLVFRWAVAYFDCSPKLLAIPIVLATLIPLVIRVVIFNKEGLQLKRVSSRARIKYQKYLLKAGSTFVVSSISVTIYSKLSIIMLGFLTTSATVGIYSISSTLAGAWSFVALSLITSSFPGIFSEKDEAIALTKVSNLSFITILVCLFFIICLYFFGSAFISLFYGVHYIAAFSPALILSISTLFSLLGVIGSRFIAKYSGYLFLSKKSLAVTFLSISLNFFLIKRYGIFGAVYASLITEIISLTLFNYLYNKGMLLKVHMRSFYYSKI